MGIDRIDDVMYDKIKLDVMNYHIQYTLQITADKLAEAGKTLGDLPIPSVEDIGNAAFAELLNASSQQNKTLKEITEEGGYSTSAPNIILRYDESDKRDFSKIFRESIIAAASNIKTFTEKFA